MTRRTKAEAEELTGSCLVSAIVVVSLFASFASGYHPTLSGKHESLTWLLSCVYKVRKMTPRRAEGGPCM